MNVAVRRRRSRIGVLTLVLAGLFLLVALRLFVLVVLDGPRLSSLALSEHTVRLELAAVRGPIVDRHGEPLALSAESSSIYARPRRLLAATSAQGRARLGLALGLSPRELQGRLERGGSFVWLARQAAREQAQAAEALGLDGVGAVNEYKRFYPESNLAAAVVGMAGVDGQGLSGLELQYDRLIRGTRLELEVARDAFGHRILDSPLALRNPEPGARLELTIDAEIQALAENRLDHQVRAAGARRGIAIVLDPFTGEVLALAIAGAERDEGRLHNAAVQDAFEPGSTIKGILGAIALEDHATTLQQKFFCANGELKLGHDRIHDHGRYGWLDLGDIIEMSSNIGAAKLALGLGAVRYYDGLRGFGFGARTEVDLPGEAGGSIRAPASWTPLDLAEHGFGQGIAVTPLQLAVAYGALANGGLLMRPYMVRAAYDSAGNVILRHTPQVLRRAVSPEVAHIMNRMLRAVVSGEEGTGHLARVADFPVAGKTGTAQLVNPVTGGYYQRRQVASFVGFLPADDPRLVILVVLEDVGEGYLGGLVAAPVFSAIAVGALSQLKIGGHGYEGAALLPPATMPADENSSEAGLGPPGAASLAPRPASAGSRIPDFSGLSLRRALALARRSGLNLEVGGSGYVMAQSPAPGARVVVATVKLTLATPPNAATDESAPARNAASAERNRKREAGA